MKNLTVNMASESEITVQGHGVHTAYEEMASALEKRSDITLIRGKFGQQVPCDVVHLHTIGPRVWGKLFQKGPKKVVSAHVVPASLVGSIRGAQYWAPLARWYMRWFYGRADKVLAVSGTVAQTLARELRISPHKIETFYNTIDMSRYDRTEDDRRAARTALGLRQDDFVVLGNGQVQPRKRLDTFAAMATALPDVVFVWVGGIPFGQLGASYGDMKRLMANLPSNMTITGVIEHSAVAQYLAAADVFCLPAEQENHPMCVLEAAGAKLPIILRDITEYDDTFGSDAIRCQKDEAFVAAVRQLRADRTFYRRQQEATARIATRFDSAAMVERLSRLYQDLLQ